MWPVVIRELQAEARHPFTYWMRSLLFQLVLAGIFGARLHQNLARRSFDFQQGRG